MHAVNCLKRMDGCIKSARCLMATHIPHLCILSNKVYKRLALWTVVYIDAKEIHTYTHNLILYRLSTVMSNHLNT